MNFMYKCLKYLTHPGKIINFLSCRGFGRFFPDEFYLKCLYKDRLGKKLNLNNPQTFNEKLQWLKLYDRRPEYTGMVDKYAVKKYVSEKIGEEYIIPTLGVWDRFEDIDFDVLPEKFVLKCTHDSGGLVICRDKSTFDRKAARKKITRSLKRNYYWSGREWPYKNVKPRIIAEQYMEDSDGKGLYDYKFFCFDGNVRAMFIATERFTKGTEVKFDFYDENFNHLPVRNGHDNAPVPPECPVHFEQMKRLASVLSNGIPHVRVDFYEIDGKIYFGEMTFFHFCGFVKFEPEEWDTILGNWIELPEKHKK